MKSMKKWIGGVALLAMAGCAPVNGPYGIQADNKPYVTRESLENMSDEALSLRRVDLDLVTSGRKMGVVVLVSSVVSSAECAKIPDLEQFRKTAASQARTLLYRWTAFMPFFMPDSAKIDLEKLMRGEDVEGHDMPFFLDIQLTFGPGAEDLCDGTGNACASTCSLVWRVIDNRLKSNGLGGLDTPSVMETGKCVASFARARPHGMKGRGGMSAATDQDAVFFCQRALERALMEMQVQIARRFPFSARVRDMRVVDGQMLLLVQEPRGGELDPGWQMMVVGSDGGLVGICEAKGGPAGLAVWRWISERAKKELTAAAMKGRRGVVEHLEKSGLDYYVVGMGLPPPRVWEREIR